MAKDPICGMDVDETVAKRKGLVSEKNGQEYFFCSRHCKDTFEEKKPQGFSTFQKLIPVLLVAVLVGGSILSVLYDFMPQFMGVFFIIVALLKMLDWNGFVNSFSMYDVIAKRIRAYAWIYPALELALGIAFLSGVYMREAAFVTLIVMALGTIGVAQNLLSKNPVKCACLGTLINIPLTKFTLVEDVLMAVMALMLLVM